jgi:hypothetical protein
MHHMIFSAIIVFLVNQKEERRSLHAQKETEFLRLKRSRLGIDDFDSLKVIGRGAFGEVSVNKDLILEILEIKTCQAVVFY